MNSGPDAEPDPSDAEVTELNTQPLQESQEAIDRGREAAREVLNDEPDWTSGEPEEPQETGDNSAGQPAEEPEG